MSIDEAHFVLVALLALAVAWDLRTRRIPNPLTITGCVVGLALRASLGWDPLLAGVLGLLLGLAVSVPMVLAGGLGGGDAKLLAMVGAFLGPGPLLPAILVMGIVGGVMAVVVAVWKGEAYDTLRRTWLLAGRLVGVVPRTASYRTIATAGALTIPYAIPIAIGAVASVFYL